MRARTLVSAFCALALAAGVASGEPAASKPDRRLGDLGQVGTVEFPTSCDPALQAEFERGVALLHSFFYREARRVFESIAAQDPECAMAHWGVAMTHYHPLWTAPDSTELAAGRAAVARARAAKQQDTRERGFVAAIAAYYEGLDDPPIEAQSAAMSCHAAGGVDHRGRAACFEREMAKLAVERPDDVEVNAFYALSLLGTAAPGDPELKHQKQAAAILEKWYTSHHNHPGLAHYLIHSYDFPPLAEKGLPAARAYASVAPWVPHALHMPSHIFTRLGMWKETIESNLASADAARKFAAENHPDAASFEELHALDYAMYGYLQTGQDDPARALLARLDSIDKTYPEVDFAAAYAFGAIPARFALERRQWKEAAALAMRPMAFWSRMPFAEGHLAYARAIGAARSGDLPVARAAADRLGELAAGARDPRLKYFADQMETQRNAALGVIACAEGRSAEGIAILRRAAAREDSLGKHPVSPGAMLPVRELLAEMLLENRQPKEALAEFQAALALNPGRFNGVYGAARAAAAAGEKSLARRYSRELTELASLGKSRRPELAEAKKLMAGR